MAPVFTNAPIDFPTASLWSQASAAEAFERDFSAHAKTLRAAELRSGWFENDGSGQFSFHPFPPAAHTAPIASLALSDFDGDGLTDCAVAQNWGRAMRRCKAGAVGSCAARRAGSSPPTRSSPAFRSAQPRDHRPVRPKRGRRAGPRRARAGDEVQRFPKPGSRQKSRDHRGAGRSVRSAGSHRARGRPARARAGAAAAPGQPLAFGLEGPSGSEPTVEVICTDGRKSRLTAPADQFRLRIDPDPPSR
ncbi:MAG: VCBS repeat-containing protein [Verrucomicrobiales bacterium]